ncbi:MAG: hypothetical protein A2289_11315 [Deltaproteobacteria bacterium RIFOXYA12_FULL_58_15]|nr:MAG: hypothetical protein A2289_11315 [Deltaproteobacteria bacterium RIFOXYA12_FULL_58_15]
MDGHVGGGLNCRIQRWILTSLSLCLASGCTSEITGPKPTLSQIAPAAVCNEQLTTTVALTGRNFSPIPINSLTDAPGLEIPDVALELILDLDSRTVDGDAFDLPNRGAQSYVRWESQKLMHIDIQPDLTLADGLYTVAVTNPNGESAELEGSLLAVPPPRLDALVPDLLCADQDNVLSLLGSAFVEINAELPAVTFGDDITIAASSIDGCINLPGDSGAKACRSLDVDIAAGVLTTNSAAYATYDVTVTNPETVACSSSEAVDLTVVPRPTLTSVTPMPVCLAQGSIALVIEGTGLLTVDGVTPTLAIGDNDVATVAVSATCTDVPTPSVAVQSCTQLTTILLQDAIDAGTYDVVVQNPSPANCSSTDAITFQVVPPPTLDTPNSTTIAELCQGGGELLVTGANIRAGATVAIGGVAASSATPLETSCDPGGLCTELTVTFGFLPVSLIANSPIDLVVENVEGCSATSVDSVVVSSGPMVLYADPPFIYNEFANEIAVYGTNFASRDIEHVELIAQRTGDVIVLCDDSGTPTACDDDLSGATGGVFRVNVPADTLALVSDRAPDDEASETFTLRATNPTDTCATSLPNAITIVKTTEPASLVMQPAFGKVGTQVPVTITMTNPSPGLLVATPRAYITSTASGAPLESVAFVSQNTLTAIVPDDLAIDGDYTDFDLTVINPDGTVFVEEGAFRISSFDAPRIDNANPGQVSPTGGAVQVAGVHFSNDPSGPNVALAQCSDPSGTMTFPDDPDGDGVNDGYILAPGSITYNDVQSLRVVLPASQQYVTCLLRVENVRDNAYDLFSAIVYANASGNIPSPTDSGQTLNVGRQGHGIAAVAATRAAHYLYAVGGDTLDPSTAVASVEYASLHLTGDLGGPFVTTRYSLNSARTYLSLLQVDRVLYAVGGADSTGVAQSTVERAVVLDPTEIVAVNMQSFEFGSDAIPALGAGGWIYQVAIVFHPNDPINPCGESLPSEPFVINLPDVSMGLVPTLEWNEANVANLGSRFVGRQVQGYRVYRTPAANRSLAEIEFLNNVDGPATVTYEDDGQPVAAYNTITGCAAVVSGTKPLALGETSKWVTLSGAMDLNGARKGAGFRSVADKTDGSNKVFLYVMSGLDGANAGRTDYELLYLDADPTQNVAAWETASGGWTQTTDALEDGMPGCQGATGRWHAGLFVANRDVSSENGADPAIADEAQYLALGPGRRPGSDDNITLVQTWEIDLTDGTLNNFLESCEQSADFAGYGNVSVNRQFWFFGGTDSDALLHGEMPEMEWEIVAGTGQLDVQNMNFTGSAMMTMSRFLHATTLDRAYIYIVGGTTTDGVTNTVELGVW